MTSTSTRLAVYLHFIGITAENGEITYKQVSANSSRTLTTLSTAMDITGYVIVIQKDDSVIRLNCKTKVQ